jgi:hypothetical protein
LINFDVFPNGSPVPDHTLITTQYVSLGVTFSSDSPSGAPMAIADSGEASSPPNILVGDWVEPCNCGLYKIFMTFIPPLPNSVGMTLISVGDGTAVVTALGSDTNLVLDAVSVTHGPSAGVGYGNHDPIVLRGAGIAMVQFEIQQTGSIIDGIGIDDLIFPFQPILSIAAASTNVVLSWPGILTNYVVEAASVLSPPVQWQPVTNHVDTVNGTFAITVPAALPSRFFKLRQNSP